MGVENTQNKTNVDISHEENNEVCVYAVNCCRASKEDTHKNDLMVSVMSQTKVHCSIIRAAEKIKENFLMEIEIFYEFLHILPFSLSFCSRGLSFFINQ